MAESKNDLDGATSILALRRNVNELVGNFTRESDGLNDLTRTYADRVRNVIQGLTVELKTKQDLERELRRVNADQKQLIENVASLEKELEKCDRARKECKKKLKDCQKGNERDVAKLEEQSELQEEYKRRDLQFQNLQNDLNQSRAQLQKSQADALEYANLLSRCSDEIGQMDAQIQGLKFQLNSERNAGVDEILDLTLSPGPTATPVKQEFTKPEPTTKLEEKDEDTEMSYARNDTSGLVAKLEAMNRAAAGENQRLIDQVQQLQAQLHATADRADEKKGAVQPQINDLADAAVNKLMMTLAAPNIMDLFIFDEDEYVGSDDRGDVKYDVRSSGAKQMNDDLRLAYFLYRMTRKTCITTRDRFLQFKNAVIYLALELLNTPETFKKDASDKFAAAIVPFLKAQFPGDQDYGIGKVQKSDPNPKKKPIEVWYIGYRGVHRNVQSWSYWTVDETAKGDERKVKTINLPQAALTWFSENYNQQSGFVNQQGTAALDPFAEFMPLLETIPTFNEKGQVKQESQVVKREDRLNPPRSRRFVMKPIRKPFKLIITKQKKRVSFL